MISTINRSTESGSAYITDQRVPASPHFTRVEVLSPAWAAQDPLGFSYMRMLQGEADVLAGHVRSLTDVMNGLRGRLHRHGG